MNKDLNKQIMEWRTRLGYRRALDIMQDEGVPRSTAQKILAGGYEFEPRNLLIKAIQAALKRK